MYFGCIYLYTELWNKEKEEHKKIDGIQKNYIFKVWL